MYLSFCASITHNILILESSLTFTNHGISPLWDKFFPRIISLNVKMRWDYDWDSMMLFSYFDTNQLFTKD
jgi:hypothetical protein